MLKIDNQLTQVYYEWALSEAAKARVESVLYETAKSRTERDPNAKQARNKITGILFTLAVASAVVVWLAQTFNLG